MSVFFTDRPVVDFDSAMTSDTKLYGRYFHYMLDHGINLAPSQFEAMFVSAAHGEEELDRTCECIRAFAQSL